jgi:hypothetical protein
MTRSLFHSRPLADRALARIAADISFPALRCTTFKEYKSTEGFAPIVVPPLCAEDKKEIRRGRNPLQTFRRALRRLEIAASVELVRARTAFALSKCATAWLPQH